MKPEEYENAIRYLGFVFFAAPAVILIGMFAVGSILDTLTNQQNSLFSFSRIFVGVGGLPSVIMYFRREWKQFNQRSEQHHALKMRLVNGQIEQKEYDEIKKRLSD